jgi:segregation and condensation protein B
VTKRQRRDVPTPGILDDGEAAPDRAPSGDEQAVPSEWEPELSEEWAPEPAVDEPAQAAPADSADAAPEATPGVTAADAAHAHAAAEVEPEEAPEIAAEVAPEAAPAPASAPSVSQAELESLQRAEEVKADPELDEVEPAAIDVSETEKEEPFEKLAARAKRLSPQRVRAVVEGLLFLAEKALTVQEIRAVTGLETERIDKALDALSGHYREGVSGVVLHEVAGGWQLRSSPDIAEFARRFLKVKPQRLTRAALETLAIIAYRQPVTRPEIEDIRSVDCGAVVKALLERRLIKILGKKEEPGRPILYGTTREFLEFFALKDLASLPTLREFHELSEEHRDIVEKEAPPEKPNIEGLVAELADPNLRAALEAKQAEADAALDELEKAIDRVDSTRATAEAALAPKKDDHDGADDGGPPAVGST